VKVAEIRITPVAIQDMPLLNTKGVHGSHFLRSIIEVECDDGTSALPNAGGINHKTMLTQHQVVDVVYSAFEIPMLDIQGHATGRSVSDLLGGAVREKVNFGAYLFFKFAKPSDQPGRDLFGDVMTSDAMVSQAEKFVGFQITRFGSIQWVLGECQRLNAFVML